MSFLSELLCSFLADACPGGSGMGGQTQIQPLGHHLGEETTSNGMVRCPRHQVSQLSRRQHINGLHPQPRRWHRDRGMVDGHEWRAPSREAVRGESFGPGRDGVRVSQCARCTGWNWNCQLPELKTAKCPKKWQKRQLKKFPRIRADYNRLLLGGWTGNKNPAGGGVRA